MRLSRWTDVPLSDAGMRDAARAAEQLRRAPEIQAVYVSTLKRARDTARHLGRAFGVPLVLDPDLREIGCGAADGRSVHDVRASYPDHWERNERQDDDDFRWPGGESYREFRERCLRAARRIAARHPGGASHGRRRAIARVASAAPHTGSRARCCASCETTRGHAKIPPDSPRNASNEASQRGSGERRRDAARHASPASATTQKKAPA
jgi:broad specificity phosphatase PhoE